LFTAKSEDLVLVLDILQALVGLQYSSLLDITLFRSQRLTTCYGLHQKTSLVNIRIIAGLTQWTPAHNALHCLVGLASGRSLGGDWRRRPGHPRAHRTDQLCNDTGSVPANL